MGRRAPAAALVEEQDVVARRVEQPAMERRTPAARAAMQEHRRCRARRTGPLPIDLVPVADIEHAVGVGLDLGIGGAQACGGVSHAILENRSVWELSVIRS